MISGKTILITGGTGSFGSAFIDYVKKLKTFTSLVVYSRDWHKQKKLKELHNDVNFVIGDVRDKDRLSTTVREYGVDVIIHAAALKDVEFCEWNPTECLQTNVIGTQNVIDVALEHEVNKCVLISTDKAVLPINTYGTSKKMAEKLCINANENSNSLSKFSVCRYGNVIGSAGSVLPVFKKMIAEGIKVLPVTDVRMTRFWYPMKDAIEFVLSTIDNMKGGEMLIPKIPSIRITDLVKAFGMEYEVIGIREGEKLHEYMIPPDEITGKEGYSSGNNEHFLTIDEIKESINEI